MTDNTIDERRRRQILDNAVRWKTTDGWVIESDTGTSVSLRRGKLNNPAWFIVSLVTTPLVFGLGFVAWLIAAAINRSKRMTIWVDPNGTVQSL